MTIDIPFAIAGWDQAPYDTPQEGPALARVTVRKTYTGALAGESTAELLLCGQEGYIANERITGTLEGRAGTFVIQHGGVRHEEETLFQFGMIIPGSGTGDLAGIRGQAVFSHGLLRLEYSLD